MSNYIFTDEQHELIKIMISDAQQEVYREIADSLKSAGERDLYEYADIEEQAAKAGCALAGERIQWLVNE